MDHYRKDTQLLLLCNLLHARPYFLPLPVSQRGGGENAPKWLKMTEPPSYHSSPGREGINIKGHLQHVCDALWDSLGGPYEIKPRVCLQRKTIWGLLLFFICFLLATSMPHWFHVSRVRKAFVVHYEVKHFTVVGFIHIESGDISTYICDSASVSFCLMEDIVVVRICSHLQTKFHVFISHSKSLKSFPVSGL